MCFFILLTAAPCNALKSFLFFSLLRTSARADVYNPRIDRPPTEIHVQMIVNYVLVWLLAAPYTKLGKGCLSPLKNRLLKMGLSPRGFPIVPLRYILYMYVFPLQSSPKRSSLGEASLEQGGKLEWYAGINYDM